MVGVGDIPLSKNLGGNRKLVLFAGWESDEGLVDTLVKEGTPLDGSLPGSGGTDYTIAIAEGDGLEPERELQELIFRGGGDISLENIPPKVKEAFDKWYAKLAPLPGITIRYVGSLRTEGEVDRVLDAIRNHTKFKSQKHSELTTERVQALRKEREILDLLRGRATKETEELARSKMKDPGIEGIYKNARVKGILLQVHPDAEEIALAFIDYPGLWLLAGSTKLDFTRTEIHEEILGILDLMKSMGVEMDVTEVWVDEGRSIKEWKTGGGEYDPLAAARGENPYYPGLPAVPLGGYRYPNPTGVWKTEARAWLDTHKDLTLPISLDDVEALYAAGAVNVDLTFVRGGRTGCEVMPPRDVESRKRLVTVMKSVAPDRVDWGGDIDYYDWLEKAALDLSIQGPWDLF